MKKNEEKSLTTIIVNFDKTQPGVNFIKALTLAFFYWCKNTKKYILALKCSFFGNKYLATCCQVKRFCCQFWHFNRPFWRFASQILLVKLNFENTIIFWFFCENFGVKAFMNLSNENAMNISAFCSTNFFGVLSLWNRPLVFMSPVSPVFHTEATVINLVNTFSVIFNH